MMFVTRNGARRGVGFYGVVTFLIFFVTMKFAFSSSGIMLVKAVVVYVYRRFDFGTFDELL